MPKTFSQGLLNRITRQDDLELINVVRISWLSNDHTYHADKVFTFDGNTTREDLASVSPITYRKTNRKSTIVGTVTISLCDTNKTYYTKLRGLRLVKAKVIIYQYFDKLFSTDFHILYQGEVASPVIYNEHERVVTFDVIPMLKGKQIPFVPSKEGTTNGDIATEEEFLGKAWPTPFGKIVDVPAQLIVRGPQVSLVSAIDESNNISFDVETVRPEDPNPFPGPTSSKDYWINEERVTGSFGTGSNAKRFTVTQRNVAKENVSTTARPSVGTDPDAALSNVVYLSSNTQIVGNWVNMQTGAGAVQPATNFFNFCYKQIGNKCWFTTGWSTSQGVNQLLGSGLSLRAKRYIALSGTRWTHNQGSIMRLNSAREQIYVFSNTPIDSDSTSGAADSEVVQVRAFRQVPIIGGPVDGQTSRVLVRVPHSYYTVQRNNSAYSHFLQGTITNRPNTLTFNPPLRDRLQGWEDEVLYVSMRTGFTSSNERNTANQIRYILENYTELIPDTTSFDAVRDLIADFDSDFMLNESRDAVEVCIDMAWQARCALIISGTIVKIKYLSINDPLASGAEGPTIDKDLITLDPISIEYTELEDLITVFNANYRETYAEGKIQTETKRINNTIFNERIEAFDFFIYQRRGLVNKSKDFWAARYGNVWKLLKVKCLLAGLRFDPLDFVNVDLKHIEDENLQLLGTSSFRGVIEDLIHNDDGTTDLLIWTPMIAGTDAKYTDGWKAVSAASTVDPLTALVGVVADDIEALADKDT